MRTEKISPKVKAMYQAVGAYVTEGADLNKLTVSDITGRAGIGKGTAYEYFHTREEIIVNAILYFETQVVEGMMTKMETRGTFQERFYYLLSCLEEKLNARGCFLKYVHLISGCGDLSRLLKEAVQEETGEKSDPMRLIRSLTAYGLQTDVLRGDLPREYLDLAVASKVMIYIFQLGRTDLENVFTQERLKKFLYDGMIREIGEERDSREQTGAK